MKIDKKSLFLGISLGAISTVVIFLSFGDVNTDFSFQIGDNIRGDSKKDINISIEKTIENGIEKATEKDDFRPETGLSLLASLALPLRQAGGAERQVQEETVAALQERHVPTGYRREVCAGGAGKSGGRRGTNRAITTSKESSCRYKEQSCVCVFAFII